MASLQVILCVARLRTIYDILRTAADSRLIPIPQILKIIWKNIILVMILPEQTTLKQFYEIKYGEVINTINFFKPDAVYSQTME